MYNEIGQIQDGQCTEQKIQTGGQYGAEPEVKAQFVRQLCRSSNAISNSKREQIDQCRGGHETETFVTADVNVIVQNLCTEQHVAERNDNLARPEHRCARRAL